MIMNHASQILDLEISSQHLFQFSQSKKQMKPISNPIMRAGSLIICRQIQKLTSFFDYQILMMTRNDNMQSFSSVAAFPGGKCDQQLDTIINNKLNLHDKVLVTALRQCFEETGIYFSEKPIYELEKLKKLETLKLKYIANQFTHHNLDLTNFFLDIAEIAPPKHNLLPFVRLVTIPLLKKRFDASFYIHKLQEPHFINFFKFAQKEDNLHNSDQLNISQQFTAYAWKNPIEVLKGYKNKQIKLAQPQFMMLSIMSQFHKYGQLQQFLKQCSQNPVNMFPNIVSIVKNQGYDALKFPYAATFVGDYEFPYEDILKSQSNQCVLKQLKLFKEKVQSQGGHNTDKNEPNKIRLLFKEPKHFFQDQYEVECNVRGSVFSKMPNSPLLQKHIDEYC